MILECILQLHLLVYIRSYFLLARQFRKVFLSIVLVDVRVGHIELREQFLKFEQLPRVTS